MKPASKSESLNAVIYARYSSHSQTEQSIEGQLHDAYAYAEKCGYHVIGEYIDRALTGKNDDRPDFQRMIRDAERRQFQIIIVWKLDRFTRNRYDSAIYKQRLKKYGVRVVSVMEAITDSPEGIILEGLLESMAEYYSANLSENIRRGQAASIAKGWFCGGSIPFGYIVHDHHLVPDPVNAPLIPEIYRRYASGESLTDIAADLNARGIHTRKGHAFTVSSFDTIIPNPAYIGEYTYTGQVIPGCASPLLDHDLYSRACARREKNRRAPAASRSHVSYILQGKLFCGPCGSPMCGDSSRSKTGDIHYYYSCSARKHKKSGCRKNREKKDFIEWYVCEQTQQYILAPERLSFIASAVADLYNSEIDDSALRDLQRRVSALEDEMNVLVERLGSVPDKFVSRITTRMEQIDAELASAQADLSTLRIQQQIRISEKEVAAWLKTFSRGDLFDDAFRQKLIDTFINSVYLWDNKVVIFYNISGARQTSMIDPLDPEEIEKTGQSATLTGSSGASSDKVAPGDPYFVLVHGMIGLVIFR